MKDSFSTNIVRDLNNIALKKSLRTFLFAYQVWMDEKHSALLILLVIGLNLCQSF